jgi:hypothetical protein
VSALAHILKPDVDDAACGAGGGHLGRNLCQRCQTAYERVVKERDALRAELAALRARSEKP